MADGVAITAGSGTTILTDDTGAGGHAQVMKLAISTDGSGTLIPADAANGLDVDVTRTPKGATAGITSVADNASSVTILASNSARLGASVFNDSSAVLYLLYGSGTASATNYTVRIYQNGYHEVFGGFTGQLTGVWATDPGDGAARVTEVTA